MYYRRIRLCRELLLINLSLVCLLEMVMGHTYRCALFTVPLFDFIVTFFCLLRVFQQDFSSFNSDSTQTHQVDNAECQKKILVLGSGTVGPPYIEYLTRNPQNQITSVRDSLNDSSD